MKENELISLGLQLKIKLPPIVRNISRKFVSKVWGWEDWIINNELYCGKILFIKAGHMTSWHYHKIKDECFYVQEGELTVRHSDYDCLDKQGNLNLKIADLSNMKKDDSLHMPPKRRHRLIANTNCYLFEFSTHHEDSDSIRIQEGR